MKFSREHALDILGLPSFATESDIILRYQALALTWFPENHTNRKLAEEEFENISYAAISIFLKDSPIHQNYKMQTIYSFFQSVFFGKKNSEVDDGSCYTDDDEESEENSMNLGSVMGEIVANDRANELLDEEEREKSKAEKRRAKKKKRKERRKQEKVSKEQKVPVKVVMCDSSTETPRTMQDTVKSAESEEDLDPNSAFVAVVAKKHKKQEVKGDIEIKDPPRRTVPKQPKSHVQNKLAVAKQEDQNSIILRSRQLALRGNELASACHFTEAVELFTESIKIDPSDHRFYGNRSYCYDRLQQYDRALKDAEKSITLCPVWAKGYFRKGRALLGLKKFALAEQAFKDTLKYDNDCEDAVGELRTVKIWQIMEKGYSKEDAELAIAMYGTVAEALMSLAARNVPRMPVRDDIFISDDEDDLNWAAPKKVTKVAEHEYDIKRDPKNPEGHNSLWIGNVQPVVTEKELSSMFVKYGELISVKVMPDKFCAFVNYKSKNSPGKAMQAYQGLDLYGTKLCIRYPNLPGEATVVKKKAATGESSAQPKGPVNGNECYYWRTTGCIYAEACRFKHIKANKGVDKKKWMTT